MNAAPARRGTPLRTRTAPTHADFPTIIPAGAKEIFRLSNRTSSRRRARVLAELITTDVETLAVLGLF